MVTHALHHYPARSELPRWIIVGAISGAVSVLLFHQGVAALLHALELIGGAPYSLQPTRPFGVPVLWSIVFWGGVWGAVLAATLGRLDGARLLLAALVFGAILPSLVALLVVAPLKGQAASIVPALILNGAWGLGTGIGLVLFGRPKAHAPV